MRKMAIVSLTAALGWAIPAAADQSDRVGYDQIAAQSAKVQADPVNIRTNYFIGWTGAWDTVVMRGTELWKEWLPEGSTVDWNRNLQGPPVITNLLAGKQQIAYLGDNPALVSTTKGVIAPINIVAPNATSPGRMCGALLVNADAPDFDGYKEAAQWLEGKTVGVPRGSCADRLAQYMFQEEGVEVEWQQMQGEVIVTSLEAGKIDAAAVYEPHFSKAIFEGIGKPVMSAAAYGERDANIVVMREDFVEENREAAKAWLKANVQAMMFMRDKPVEFIGHVKDALPQYSRETLWHAIFGGLPDKTGASDIVFEATMAFTPESRALMNRAYDFLYEIDVVTSPEMAPNAIRTDLVSEALRELGLPDDEPLFQIREGDLGPNPFDGDELVGS